MKKNIHAPSMVNIIWVFCVVLFGVISIISTSGDEIEEEPPEGLNTNPTATITAPEDDPAVFLEGDRLTFSGTATDAEEGTLSGGSLVWTSSKSGWLGTGTSIHDITLATGTHAITLSASDSRGGSGSTSVQVTISQSGATLPTALIDQPANDSTFSKGDFIKFSGTGSDPEDGMLAGNALVWASNKDGQLGTGNTLENVNYLSNGQHTITLMATDSDGTTGTASINITVGNQPPTASIDNPASDGQEFNAGEYVFFSGTGTDEEDGALDGQSLEWRSSKKGKLGNGSTLFDDSLSPGGHVITLIATDSSGATGFATVGITIVNNPPDTPEILSPPDGGSYDAGNLIVFNGRGEDDEDGLLSGASLVWTSDIDLTIGTGTSFSTSSLSVGDHLITLTVTDSNGASESTTIDLSVQ